MKKQTLTTLFFELLNSKSEATFETIMIAIEALMAAHWVTFRDCQGIVDQLGSGHQCPTVQQLFDYHINNLAVSNSYKRFDILCEFFMDFSLMEAKVKHNENFETLY